MALNGLNCAAVPLRIYSLTHFVAVRRIAFTVYVSLLSVISMSITQYIRYTFT